MADRLWLRGDEGLMGAKAKEGARRTKIVGAISVISVLCAVVFAIGTSVEPHSLGSRVAKLQHARPIVRHGRSSRIMVQKRAPSLRRDVFMRAETDESVGTLEKEPPAGFPDAMASSNPSGLTTVSALEGMLGESDSTSSVLANAKTDENESKAQHALDMLSGWFGPDEAQIEAENEKERRKKEAEDRLTAEKMAADVTADVTPPAKDPNLSVITEVEVDEKVPDEVMRVLGLGKGAKNMSADVLLEDLKERAKNGDEKDKELMEAVTSFLNTAQQYQGQNVSENQLRDDFVNLLDKLQPENRVDSTDMKKIQKEILGPNTFYVTSADAAAKFDGVFGLRDTGYVFCGNFRGKQDEIFPLIAEKVKVMFDGKYQVFLIPDPELEVDPFYDGDQNKAALQVVPADRASPSEQPGWTYLVSIALFAATLLGAVQLGVQAASIQLPGETVDWLTNPDNFKVYDPQVIPPGLQGWNPQIFLTNVGQIAAGLMSVSLIHELGHRVSAYLRKVKLGAPLFLPLGNLPTSFGTITRLQSMVKSNSDLFDIAAAGPVSGVVLATILFVAGLALTGQTDQNLLVALPYPFVQQSLLLGTMVKGVLGVGDGALTTDALLVHPLVVAGWVGLVSQAFNSLPVGCLDGGRMVQATFGSGPLGFTSFLTYIALGFGVLGGPVDGLLFGLYLLFLQRNSEKYIQDTVTLADDKTRRGISLALVIFAALVLTPLG